MSGERCQLTELLVRQCAHCVAPHRPTPADPFGLPAPRSAPWFRASYPGDCSGCGDEFDAGDRIRADGEGGYLAECCGSDE